MDPKEYKIWQTAKAQGKDDVFIKGAIQAYRQIKTTAPVNDVASERASRESQGLPVSVNPNKAKPSFVGDLLRGIIKPFVRGVNTVIQPIQAAVTGQNISDIPTNNDYLGDVSGFGMRDNQTAGQRVKDVVGGVAEIGANFIGAGGVGGAVKTGLKGLVKQGAKEGAITGLKAGGLQGFGSALQQDKGVGGTLTGTAIGAVGGGLLGGAIGGVAGGIAVGKTALAGKAPGTFTNELDNRIAQALASGGKRNIGAVQRDISQNRDGFNSLYNRATKVKVTNSDGIEASYNPFKATIGENVQALSKSKAQVYEEYTRLATQAGDTGATVDVTPIVGKLRSAEGQVGRRTPAVAKVSSIADDLERNFPDGRATPAQLQTFIEDLNQETMAAFKTGNFSASQDVAAMTAKDLREAADSTIQNATGAQYQKLRNEYGALKSIESGLAKRLQQQNRKVGEGIPGYLDIWANLDLLTSVLTANPVTFAKGSALRYIANKLKLARDPEKMLQTVFEAIKKNREGTKGALYSAEETIQAISKAKTPNPTAVQTPANIKVKTIPTTNSQANVVIPRSKPQPKTTSSSLSTLKKKTLFQSAIENIKKDGQAGFAEIIKPTKNSDSLTTTTLSKLSGRKTVSKQFISDLTNSGDIKQVERDLIRNALETEGNVVNVSDFAKKVKAELLPLKVTDPSFGKERYKYEQVSLSADIRGNVKNYKENVYESPIQTSAGMTHFAGSEGSDNYFGHTRIEDMADNKTRRVIEVQSDLYQKGNLEKETTPDFKKSILEMTKKEEKYYDELSTRYNKANNNAERDVIRGLKIDLEDTVKNRFTDKQKPQLSKLQQYNDPTAHFRMIREEIKKAAEDGKTKLQFPTGETAMKIEGLGENTTWFDLEKHFMDDAMSGKLSGQDLVIGKEVSQGVGRNADKWIITDVLGDGKFKAVPKDYVDKYKTVEQGIQQARAESSRLETFDISGKVDTNNPIYKFYEKDVQKYLNKFGGQKVKDEQGVNWVEILIKPEMANQPVMAFGKAQLGTISKIGIGLGAVSVGLKVKQKLKEKK